MRWTPLLLCFVTNLLFSRANGKVQLTVDVAGATKTSVNIRPDWPQLQDPVNVLTRTKRASGIRPFSVETPESGPSSDYQTLNPATGAATNIDYNGGSMSPPGPNAQSNPSASGGQGSGFARQPGRQPPMGGGGGPRGQFGGPNRPNRGNQMRCRGNSNSPACRNNRGNQGRRGHGHRQPQYGNYGNWQSGPGGQRGPRNQRNRQRNNSGGQSGSSEYMDTNY